MQGTIQSRRFHARGLLMNNKGSVLAATVFIISVLGLAAMSTAEVLSDQGSNTINQMQVSQALYVGQAGIEYTKRKLYLGQFPDINQAPFSYGTFSVTTDPSLRFVTVDAEVGNAKKTQTLLTNFSKDVVAFNTMAAQFAGKNLDDVQLVKTTNITAIISKMWINWNWDSCVTSSVYDPVTNDLSGCPVDTQNATIKHIGIDGTAIYNPGNGIGSPGGGGADANQEIDVVDYNLTGDQTYTFAGPPQPIRFSQTPPANGLYTITIEFLDESQASHTFQE